MLRLQLQDSAILDYKHQPNGDSKSRLFDVEQDEDWFAIETVAGAIYIIQTENLSLGVDTVIELYDTDGLTILDSNNDSGGELASRLEWKAPANKTYFIRVTSAEGGSVGCQANYELAIEAEYIVRLPIITD